MDDNKAEGTDVVRADKLPRLRRITQSILNIERLGNLEGITSDNWQKGLTLLKKELQERSKA